MSQPAKIKPLIIKTVAYLGTFYISYEIYK